MKKIMYVLLLALIFGSCTKVEQFNTYDIKVGDTIDHDKELSVTLQKIEDSRCPKDVVCVWEGEVEASLVLDLDEASDYFVVVSSMRPDTTIAGYKFTLIEVTPYPESTETIPQEDYVVRLLIE